MKLVGLMVLGASLGLSSANASAADACRNSSEIHRSATELTLALQLMMTAAQENYRWAPNLRQSLRQAEVAAHWLQRVTESAWVPCDFTLSSADSLEVRMRGLRNQYRSFAFFRNEAGVEKEYEQVLESYSQVLMELEEAVRQD
jgi:hypothetical protein